MITKAPQLKVLDGGKRPGLLHVMDQPEQAPERSDAARNRQRILDAARKLMGRRAIKDICMDELARAAGVGKGTLYRRFVDRSSLCMALLDESEKGLQERLLRRFDLPRSACALTRLHTLLEALFDFTLENAQLLAEAYASHKGGPERFDGAPYVWRRTELQRLLDAAMDEKAIPHVHSDVLAELMLSALDPEMMLAQLGRGLSEANLKAEYLRFWGRAAFQKA